MINNARAESDARTARGGEAHALAQSHDYDTDADRRTDAEGSPFEENLDPRIPGGVAGPRKRDSV